MTALVQLEDEVGPIWVNPIGVLAVVGGDNDGVVYVHMTGGFRVNLPIPEGSSPEGHARMVVGKLNTGLVAEFK